MAKTPIPGILSQELFVQYAASWLETVESADSTALRQSFEASGRPRRLQAIHFPMPQVVRLVSTVGAARIKASFVILPTSGEPGGKLKFSLVLSASNSLDARVSSYYLAEEYQLPEGAEANSPDDPAALALGAVPGVLIRDWQRLWTQAPQLLPAMFNGNYGYLRGYTFELSDFVAALAKVDSPTEGSLVIHFGLHEYYRPDPVAGDVLTQTFGLILQTRDVKRNGLADGNDPFYDMSAPCPPTC